MIYIGRAIALFPQYWVQKLPANFRWRLYVCVIYIRCLRMLSLRLYFGGLQEKLGILLLLIVQDFGFF